MRPSPDVSDRHDAQTSTALCDYYVVVGFAEQDNVMRPAEVTFVADLDLALDLSREDEPSLVAVAVYALAPCPDGEGYRRPKLLSAAGPLPDAWTDLPKDFIFAL